MFNRLLALLAVLFLACVACGQSVRLPQEVKGNPGGFVRIPAETADKSVKWFTPDAGLNVFPTELLKDSKVAVVTALSAGRYRVYAWSAKGDVPSDLAECIVIIGEPGPVPPNPVPPNPVPPVPDDGRLGLVKASRTGLAAVTLVNKATIAKALASSNRALASKIAAGAVTDPAAILDEWRAGNRAAVGDPNVATWKAWADSVTAAVAALHKGGKLATKADWVDGFNEIAKGLE